MTTDPGKSQIDILPMKKDHIKEMVALHFECFTPENNFSMRFGKKFVAATYQFFHDDTKSFGFVAISSANNKMVGLITGRLDYYTAAMNHYRRPHMIRAVLSNPFTLFNISMIKRIIPLIKTVFKKKVVHPSNFHDAPSHVEGKTATLGSLCVHPDYTKYKISDMLIENAESYTRQSGMVILRTGIAKSNLLSRFAFKKRGYEEDKVLSGDSGLFYYLHL